jgi:hypothetical protein
MRYLFESGDHRPIFEHLHQAETLAQALGDHRRLGWVFSYLTRHLCTTADYAVPSPQASAPLPSLRPSGMLACKSRHSAS